MGNFRILKKSLLMSTRVKKRFVLAVLFYCILSWWVAFTIQLGNSLLVVLGILGGLIIATVYGFILSQFRKGQIATLKCIGWGNSNILLLLIGEILFVSLLGYILTLEIDIHILGVSTYFEDILRQFVFSGPALAIALLVVIGAQVPGIILAYWRTLKVRPIVALKA
ncbi:MAG: FtsX-like permease family protein [Candidatus Odinarchaeota archaeon]